MLANGVVMDLKKFLKFILVLIILLVGFLAWLENKVTNSNEVNKQKEEVVEVGDEINLLFEQDDEENKRSEYCVCSFCGKFRNIITRCSRCKNAIYWYVSKFHSIFPLSFCSLYIHYYKIN